MIDLDALVAILTALKLALELRDRMRRDGSRQRSGDADDYR